MTGQAQEREDLKSFQCPITHTIMRDPVKTKYGHSFEKEAIEEWLKKDAKCPITRQPLGVEDIFADYTLKSAIDEYLQKHQYKH